MRRFKECKNCTNYVSQFFGCDDCEVQKREKIIRHNKKDLENPKGTKRSIYKSRKHKMVKDKKI